MWQNQDFAVSGATTNFPIRLTPASYRIDIQALRGVAVLLVVFYHLGWFKLDGGYLGVDMFFVISGFVITKLITASLASGSFSIVEFYRRRAWRLLPPLFATLVLASVAAAVLLTEIDLRAFGNQTLGAVFMVVNLVLWHQGGYFETPAALKPLLNLWSLSIEQQFYVMFPWLLLFIPAARRIRWIVAIGAASPGLALVLAQRAPDAAFYMLMSRVWEFFAGALIACRAAPDPGGQRLGPGITILLLAGVLLPAIHPLGTLHPGLDAILVCSATSGLLWRSSVLLSSGWHARVLAATGAISYSLYLVHWPLLAFYRHYNFNEALSVSEGALLFATSIALAVCLYAVVERPLRKTPAAAGSKLIALSAVGVLLAIWSGSVGAQAAGGSIDWAFERRPNHGLSIECEFEGAFDPRPQCMTSAQPNLLVWGDSVAMQYVAGIVAGLSGTSGLVQATMSTCGPILDVSPVYSGRLGEAWALKCMAFNESVVNWAVAQPKLTHIVMAARFFHYVESGQKLLTRRGVRPQAVAVTKPYLVDTIGRLQAAGKKVVIVAPPPDEGFDVGACIERLLRGKSIGRRANCDIDRRAYEVLNREVIALLRAAPVSVLWPSDLLCDRVRCAVMLDGQPIYRDAAHLSYRGSVLFARRFRLAQKLID